MPIEYKELKLDAELRFDLLVNECVLVELKAVQEVHPVEVSKLLSYMKLLKKPKGLLINFFTDRIKNGVQPFVNEFFSELHDE